MRAPTPRRARPAPAPFESLAAGARGPIFTPTWHGGGDGKGKVSGDAGGGGAEGQGAAERKWEPELVRHCGEAEPGAGGGSGAACGRPAPSSGSPIGGGGGEPRRRRQSGGGGEEEAEASGAAGGRARAAPACGITRGLGGARGSRLPVKNVSHQRRPGTGRPHTVIPSPRGRRLEGGGPAASAPSLPPCRHGERRAIGARDGGPCPAPAAPIYNRRAAPAPLRLPAAGPSPAWRLCVCPRRERALTRPRGRPFPLAAPGALRSALPGFSDLWLSPPFFLPFFPHPRFFFSFGPPSPRPPLLPAVLRLLAGLRGFLSLCQASAALPLLAGAFLPWSSLPPWASASPPKFSPRSLLPPFYFLCAFSVLCLLSLLHALRFPFVHLFLAQWSLGFHCSLAFLGGCCFSTFF